MQTRGSSAASGLGEREEELRRRNEDVDRRRADALRIASDVVRHQEVMALHRPVLSAASVRRSVRAAAWTGVTADGAPTGWARENNLTCPCRPRPPAHCARQEKLVHSPGSARVSARSERASAESSPAKSATSSHSRPHSAHSRCVRDTAHWGQISPGRMTADRPVRAAAGTSTKTPLGTARMRRPAPPRPPARAGH